MDVSGRRVMVTGASRGIGRAIAAEFARCGARVALVALSEGELVTELLLTGISHQERS